MLLTTAIAAMAMMSIGADNASIHCPVQDKPAQNGTAFTDYNGVRFEYCCAGCAKAFEKSPEEYLQKAIKEGKTVGYFLFDPVSRKPIKRADAVANSDYKGVRFFFSSQANKAKFDENPKVYGELPEKECLYCPVGKEPVPNYVRCTGYADYKGVRYYLCCFSCDEEFAADQENLAQNANKHVMKPGIHNP